MKMQNIPSICLKLVCDIFRVWSGLHWSARPSLIESCNWIESCNVSFRVHRFVHQKPASVWWSYQRWWRKWFWPELPVIMWIQIPTPHKVRSSLSMLYVWRIIVYSFRCKCWTQSLKKCRSRFKELCEIFLGRVVSVGCWCGSRRRRRSRALVASTPAPVGR